MTKQNETCAMRQQHGRINREGKFTPVSDVKPIKIAVQDDDVMPVHVSVKSRLACVPLGKVGATR